MRPQILPRKPDIDTRDPADPVPRHWLAGNPLASFIADSVSLLFPAGERFFVRSVRHYLDRLDPVTDATLIAEVRGFFAQEGRHAQAHEDDGARLRAEGLRIDGFLKVYQFLCYRVLERLSPPSLRLAATAAAEHFTALLAEGALSGPMLVHAHPAMTRLLRWHAAEEIEHKSVAFDVLQRVAPSYIIRVLGLGLASSILVSFWLAGALMLLAQDGQSLRSVRAQRQRIRAAAPEYAGIARRIFLGGIRDYLRRDFHPSQRDNYALAEEYLKVAGMTVAS